MTAEKFINRHIGPRAEEISKMLDAIGVETLDELIDKTVPKNIQLEKPLNLAEGMSEYEYFKRIKKIASKNKVFKSYIGTGYYNTVFPAVIQRNILENPSWYTSYTPYQAEISQGRLEALLNFQTVIVELTGMDIANASLLDEGTAAAEAMTMLYSARSRKQAKDGFNKFFVDENIFPQTLNIIQTRATPLGIDVITGNYQMEKFENGFFGAFVQYPAGDGQINDYKNFVTLAHAREVSVGVAADLLSLTMLTPPGSWGVDVVVGSAQRFGIPMGFGGPHAAFFATRESYKRYMPGRIIGISKDKKGDRALRMALQTREQHIKREKATSNICTAQALLAIMSGMYAVYHGPDGLRKIALHCHHSAAALSKKLEELGFKQLNNQYFDTIKIGLPEKITQRDIEIQALEREINLRYFDEGYIGISIDETTGVDDLNRLIKVFAASIAKPFTKLHKLDDTISINKDYFSCSRTLKSMAQ